LCIAIYRLQSHFFKAKLIDYDLFLCAYAADINRFGNAALESLNEIHYKPLFSKSHSWKCIKAYYAAYYSVQALLRMHGISCTHFERDNLNRIESIAEIWGMQCGITIEKGYYRCNIDSSGKEILCNKIVATGSRGSHEQLWSVFLSHLEYIISELSKSTVSSDMQKVLSKLLDLKNTLTSYGANGGNWLSKVRNEINYKHVKGLWYPFRNAEKYFDKIESIAKNWVEMPDVLDLSVNNDKPILQFMDTCIFLVSLYLNSAKNMDKFCPKGKSFQSQGVLSLVNKIGT
jgi:hypothetical protein